MGEVCFNLKCLVEKMTGHLTLGVKGQCFKVQPLVSYETETGKKVVLSNKEINRLEIKSVY